jgi:hypothetical protein
MFIKELRVDFTGHPHENQVWHNYEQPMTFRERSNLVWHNYEQPMTFRERSFEKYGSTNDRINITTHPLIASATIGVICTSVEEVKKLEILSRSGSEIKIEEVVKEAKVVPKGNSYKPTKSAIEQLELGE